MDFLQPQQDVLFSLYTRLQFLILQSDLGSRKLSLLFSFIHIFICNCYWAFSQHWNVTKQKLLNCLFCSSRVASRGIVLAESQSDEPYDNNAPGSIHVQSSAVIDLPSSSTSGASISSPRWLKEKLNGLWLYALRRWPTVQLSIRQLAHSSLDLCVLDVIFWN